MRCCLIIALGVIISNLSIPKRFYRLLFLICIPGLLVILAQLLDERSEILEQSEHHALLLAQHIVAVQSTEINNTKALLLKLSQQVTVRDFTQGQCPPLLDHAQILSNDIANIGIVALNGQVMCSLQTGTRSININDRDYFQTVLSTNQFAIGHYQQDRSVHRATVNFAMPIFNDAGVLKSVLVAVKPLDKWSQALAKLPLPQNSQVMLSDANHNIIAHSPFNQALLGTHSDDYWPQINPNQAQILDDDNGHRRIYFTLPLTKDSTPNPLTVHVSLPFEQAIAQANKEVAIILLLFFLAIAVLMWQAHWNLQRVILRPLQNLVDAIEELSQGLPVRWSQKSQTPEFNAIAMRFEQMANIRLNIESALSHKHAELSALLESMPDSYLRLSKQGKVLMRHGTFAKQAQQLEDMFPEHIYKRLMSELSKLNEHSHCQLEFSLHDNQNRHVYECRLSPITHYQQAIVVIRDISQRKKQEEAINLAALVYNNSSEGMVITDANGHILDTNPAFSQVTGFKRSEVIGKTTAILASGKHEQAFYEQMWQQLDKDGNWQGEIVNRRKNGELYTEWLTINSVYNANNEPYRRVAIFTDITEKKKQDELIWRQAHYDQLTELANRTQLKRHLKSRLGQSKQALAILLLDLDHFKDINDTLGHFYGDQLLMEVANRLTQLSPLCSLISRIGGDEFVLVTRYLDDEALAELADKVLQQLQPNINIGNESCHISASIGIARAPKDGNTSEHLLKAADQAMYQAKQQGRSGYTFFSNDMREQAENRMKLLKDLRIAQQHQQFCLYYQPIVNLNTLNIEKAEALIRWQHPQKGLVSPDVFIPLAEETQLIHKIGEFIFASACQTLGKVRKSGENLQLSINVSPVQFTSKHCYLNQWHIHLEQHNLAPHDIVIEITEGLMMNAQPRTQKRLNNLTAQGFSLALDDFGTGYSSLAYLKQMDTDYIKIDKRFVDGIADNKDDLALCEAMIMMAHQLGLQVIAEGIETQAQHQLLQQAGCDFGQGYYYAKPMPEESLLALLSND
ncbi:EAL domain-containing protein [Pseudoalteromonas sp. MMG022]|uniref:EAL domain-containing protein n=1 Tax=Pseudoalteromonas sp. MMG022 TaxID=2909978 RepID=UPI001F2D5298|nr:EAL domain-containing protein [Pseudoalteromonas sp. MMG022]MCF6434915.1 EAL domain-containing protein [Pseudoalteromonas sp. MMG022]